MVCVGLRDGVLSKLRQAITWTTTIYVLTYCPCKTFGKEQMILHGIVEMHIEIMF